MDVMIRPARAHELGLLVKLERAADAAFAQIGLAQVLAAGPAEAGEHSAAQVAGRLLVAQDPRGTICGFVRVELVDGVPHIEQVSVHPSWAGHGLGARLMARAERWALQHGHHRMTLCTYRDVPWNGPYYRRLGWTPIPDDALGPELRKLREHERRMGLEVRPRQCLQKAVAPS